MIKVSTFWLAKAIARHSSTGLNIIIFHDGFIFHTAMIINRKNWRIIIKRHFENPSIFFKKSKRTQMLGPSPLPLFTFVRFSMTPSAPLLSTNVLFEWRQTKPFYLIRYHALSLFFKLLMSFCCGKFIFEIKCITFFLNKSYLVQYCKHNWITKDKNEVLNYL